MRYPRTTHILRAKYPPIVSNNRFFRARSRSKAFYTLPSHARYPLPSPQPFPFLSAKVRQIRLPLARFFLLHLSTLNSRQFYSVSLAALQAAPVFCNGMPEKRERERKKGRNSKHDRMSGLEQTARAPVMHTVMFSPVDHEVTLNLIELHRIYHRIGTHLDHCMQSSPCTAKYA